MGPRGQDSSSLSSLLKHAAQSKSLRDGHIIHDRFIRNKYFPVADAFLGNHLIELYGSCGYVQDARSVFDDILKPNLCSWNMLIKAYGNNGLLDDAWTIFEQMPHRDVHSWSAIISLLVNHCYAVEALMQYHQMNAEGICANNVSLVAALNACASSQHVVEGHKLHLTILELGYGDNVVVVTTLIKMYGNCGKVQTAWNAFERFSCKDVIAWNAITGVFAHNGDFGSALRLFKMAPERNTASWNTMISASIHGCESLRLFAEMTELGVKLSTITFMCVINSCASIASLNDGELVHVFIVESGLEQCVDIGNALISMYGRCKNVITAMCHFRGMHSSDVVSWTAIIKVCIENDYAMESLHLIHEMQLRGFQPDEVTFLCALDACAMLATLDEGQKVVNDIIKCGLDASWMVRTAIIDMYGKCGKVGEAWDAFNWTPGRNIATWNAILTSFAHNGLVNEVLHVFYEMHQWNVQPNHVTLSCLLTSCSHSGWIKYSNEVFLFMEKYYCISHTEDHYLSMIDLLCRAGQLDKAEQLISLFPFEHDEELAWQCLLRACKIHNDVDRGVRVGNHCLQINPENHASYALLSKIQYAKDSWDIDHG